MTRALTLIDGRKDDRVPASDRGLHYGDGLFETIAVRHGRPCLWHRHWTRLTTGCARLHIPVPDAARVSADVERLLIGADAGDGVLKLMLTRGSGPRGYAPPPAPTPRCILSFAPGLPGPSAGAKAGVRLTLCEAHLGENPRLAGIKHLNRLEQVLARAEWSDPAILDGLMCNAQGQVVCGTMSNVFVLDDHGLATPPLTTCGVAGTVRAVVYECADALGIPVSERVLRPAELFAARGLIITNALRGAVPVADLGGHPYPPEMVPAELIERVRQIALEPETHA
ncbi:MAG: aminodeoxychorismate lyase [Gammaproteobacteria bacterium]|jgi:4-amino-4-deoxychorismate lyase|nr:aminodeoxychorismate lyase [Gammaproteobacteria bacterium]